MLGAFHTPRCYSEPEKESGLDFRHLCWLKLAERPHEFRVRDGHEALHVEGPGTKE